MIVEDNGVGIEKDSIERVLQFGYTTKEDGHGIGLHSSLIAAQQIGGRLAVESNGNDCGSRFTLTVPVRISSSGDASGQTIPVMSQSTGIAGPKVTSLS